MTPMTPRWRDVGGMDAVFWDLRRTCALGRVLEVSCGAGEFVRRLVQHGVDAHGVDRDRAAIATAERDVPGRCRLVTGPVLPFENGSFETVVCLCAPDPAAGEPVEPFIAELHRVAARHVLLRVVSGPAREWWDTRFLQAGFRRHPALFSVVDFASLESEAEGATLLFERIPDDARLAFPLAALASERDLHMDMLREAGRRSDAHLQRYAFAATLVRPGDRVLDAACGLGYGVATIAATGRASSIAGIDDSAFAIDYARRMYGRVAPDVAFMRADAHALEAIDDHSIDLVISFETIEHLRDPRAFLANVARVLRPGGRVVGSVPNEWLDEAGQDPNPHHLHVFDADRFAALFDAPFLVEGLFVEIAGGGMKVLPDPARAWRRVAREDAARTPAEWWVLVAMKDPRAGRGLAYDERLHPIRAGAFQPTALSFPPAYANPWLRHAVVSQGVRISDPALRAAVARDVEAASAAGSVDQGAVICVQGHHLLTDAQADAADTQGLVARIERWLDAAGDRPHEYRWRVSLESLAGHLSLYAGNRDAALRWFERCASRSAHRFSPLLATKTVEAAYFAGLVRLWQNDANTAGLWWSLGLDHARDACASDWREVVGDAEQPFTAGLRELTQVLDHAARCAAGLNALATTSGAPGRLADLLLADCRADRERVRELEVGRQPRAVEGRVAPPVPAPAGDAAVVERLCGQLHDADERLCRLRGLLAAIDRPSHTWHLDTKGDRPMHRIVICDAGDAGRRLWETLTTRPGVQVVGFVDPQERRQAREYLGTAVRPPGWLRDGGWDYVAVPAHLVDEWQPQLAAAGADPARIIALPADEDEALLSAVTATLFPDPLDDLLATPAGRPVVRAGIFGTGAGGMKVWEVLVEMDEVEAAWFADNNPARQGTEILGVGVIAPDDVPARGYDVVIVGSMSRGPIREQLLSLGVPARRMLTPDVTAPIADLGRELAAALAPIVAGDERRSQTPGVVVEMRRHGRAGSGRPGRRSTAVQSA